MAVPRWRRPTFQMLSCQRDKRATRAISHSLRHPLSPDRGPVGRRTSTESHYQLKGADEPSPSNRCQESTPPRPYDGSRGRQRVNRNCPYSITPTAHYWRWPAAMRVMLLFSGSLSPSSTQSYTVLRLSAANTRRRALGGPHMALAEPHSPFPSFLACTVHQNSTTLKEE